MLTLERPATKLWTRDEFCHLDDLGFFAPDQRVELIQGEIIDMGSQGSPHYQATDRTMRVLMSIFEPGHWVRNQGPLRLSNVSQPVPDIAVAVGTRDDYDDHPTTAVLVVEVSDTSLSFDRNQKARMYAQTGIADYWIVNVNNRQLEVRRCPNPESGYAEVIVLNDTDAVSAVAAAHVSIAVKDLLPR